MPHLQELSKKYGKKVTFVALSDESVEKIEEFLGQKSRFGDQTWGEAMPYTVATDSDGSVKEAIFRAAGQRGIPSSFIIADGKVQWIGHPMRMDEPLAKVVAGEWSIEAAKAEAEKAKVRRAKMNELRQALMKASQEGEWEPAVALLDKFLAEDPEDAEILRVKWQVLCFELEDEKGGFEALDKLTELSWDSPSALNEIAWTLVDDARVKNRRLDFALRVAERAVELSKGEDASILDTLARAHYERGELNKAIEVQKKAVKKAEGPMKEDLQRVLDKYLGGKP